MSHSLVGYIVNEHFMPSGLQLYTKKPLTQGNTLIKLNSISRHGIVLSRAWKQTQKRSGNTVKIPVKTSREKVVSLVLKQPHNCGK